MSGRPEPEGVIWALREIPAGDAPMPEKVPSLSDQLRRSGRTSRSIGPLRDTADAHRRSSSLELSPNCPGGKIPRPAAPSRSSRRSQTRRCESTGNDPPRRDSSPNAHGAPRRWQDPPRSRGGCRPCDMVRTRVGFCIDPATGRATKIVNLVGSNFVMGLAFGSGQTICHRLQREPGALFNRHRNRF